MIDLLPKYLLIVENILKQYVPNHHVIAFGSRVKGKAKKFSDLDVCIMAEKQLSHHEIWNLKEAFAESDLPIRVDVVQWATIRPEFREIIMKNCHKII
jgi:predicted nucleotidyltransferase